MIEIIDKNTKISDINIFHIFKKMEKIMSIFRTYIENIKKTQTELPEMKNIIFDMKKTHWQELH